MLKLKRILHLGLFGALACLVLPENAQGSTVIDLDRKLMIFKNDGDGMQYVLSGDMKKSIRYSEENKYPLGADGQLRFIAEELACKIAKEMNENGVSYRATRVNVIFCIWAIIKQ